MDRTLQDFEDATKALKRAADEWKVEATSEVTAKASIDTTKFYRLFEDIDRQVKNISSALGKFTRDPDKMKPQLDNIDSNIRNIDTDLRVMTRMVEAFRSGKGL